MPKHRLSRKDASGRSLKTGDMVRVMRVPDLRGMSESALRESLPVFQHLVGTYRRIQLFDRHGFARISFRIRRGPCAGLHDVAIEPFLLRRKDTAPRRTRASGTAKNRHGWRPR